MGDKEALDVIEKVDPPPAPKRPDAGTLAIAFYNAARSEIVQRISLRDTTFLAWVTTTGVLLGFGAKEGTDAIQIRLRIAQLLPILSLVFGSAVYRHTYLISSINHYTETHLNRFLGQAESSNVIPRHWDNSPSMKERVRNYLIFEVFTYLTLMIGPSVGSVIYLWNKGMRLHNGWFIEACLCTFAVLVLFSYRYRGVIRKPIDQVENDPD